MIFKNNPKYLKKQNSRKDSFKKKINVSLFAKFNFLISIHSKKIKNYLSSNKNSKNNLEISIVITKY